MSLPVPIISRKVLASGSILGSSPASGGAAATILGSSPGSRYPQSPIYGQSPLTGSSPPVRGSLSSADKTPFSGEQPSQLSPHACHVPPPCPTCVQACYTYMLASKSLTTCVLYGPPLAPYTCRHAIHACWCTSEVPSPCGCMRVAGSSHTPPPPPPPLSRTSLGAKKFWKRINFDPSLDPNEVTVRVFVSGD